MDNQFGSNKYSGTIKLFSKQKLAKISKGSQLWNAVLELHGHAPIEIREKEARRRLKIYEKSRTVSLGPEKAIDPLDSLPKPKRKALLKKKDSFYMTWEWKAARYEALKRYGPKCMLCGVTSADARICVDHIKPRSKYPLLALDVTNLQVLCDSCNRGKSNIHEDDWRNPLDQMFRDKMQDENA